MCESGFVCIWLARVLNVFVFWMSDEFFCNSISSYKKTLKAKKGPPKLGTIWTSLVYTFEDSLQQQSIYTKNNHYFKIKQVCEQVCIAHTLKVLYYRVTYNKVCRCCCCQIFFCFKFTYEINVNVKTSLLWNTSRSLF